MDARPSARADRRIPERQRERARVSMDARPSARADSQRVMWTARSSCLNGCPAERAGGHHGSVYATRHDSVVSMDARPSARADRRHRPSQGSSGVSMDARPSARADCPLINRFLAVVWKGKLADLMLLHAVCPPKSGGPTIRAFKCSSDVVHAPKRRGSRAGGSSC